MRAYVVVLTLIAFAVSITSCAPHEESAVEGRLLDWNGEPVADVTIRASQLLPIRGYDEVEAVTKSDGTFRIDGLFRSSEYVLKPWSEKWTCDTEVQVNSAPEGKTRVLSEPMVITQAFSQSGDLILDLAKGKP
jgi:hypothetical protein